MSPPAEIKASGSSDIYKYHHLNAELVQQLVAIYRIMFPHNGVPDGFYEQVVRKLDDKAQTCPVFFLRGLRP